MSLVCIPYSFLCVEKTPCTPPFFYHCAAILWSLVCIPYSFLCVEKNSLHSSGFPSYRSTTLCPSCVFLIHFSVLKKTPCTPPFFYHCAAILCVPLSAFLILFSVLKKLPALPHLIRINNINTHFSQPFPRCGIIRYCPNPQQLTHAMYFIYYLLNAATTIC